MDISETIFIDIQPATFVHLAANTHLRLESHIQHAISLVENEVRNTFEISISSLKMVNESSRSRNLTSRESN
jgi:hypothetical protein